MLVPATHRAHCFGVLSRGFLVSSPQNASTQNSTYQTHNIWSVVGYTSFPWTPTHLTRWVDVKSASCRRRTPLAECPGSGSPSGRRHHGGLSQTPIRAFRDPSSTSHSCTAPSVQTQVSSCAYHVSTWPKFSIPYRSTGVKSFAGGDSFLGPEKTGLPARRRIAQARRARSRTRICRTVGSQRDAAGTQQGCGPSVLRR